MPLSLSLSLSQGGEIRYGVEQNPIPHPYVGDENEKKNRQFDGNCDFCTISESVMGWCRIM
jgi:hypothetical protein